MPPKKGLPTWNLKKIFSEEKQLQHAIRTLKEKVHHFTNYRAKLPHATPKLVEEILQKKEEMAEMQHTIGVYTHLKFVEDTKDEKAKAMEASFNQLGTELGNQLLFFGLWWKDLDDKRERKLLPKGPDHRHHLLRMRKYKKHTLSEKEEQLANLKDTTGEDALVKLYDILTNDFVFPWKKGKKIVEITEEELRSYARSPVTEERVKAYDLLWNKFGEHTPTLGEIYRNLVLDAWNENIKLRKYARPISARNLSNDLSDEMVETFLHVCLKNTGVFQEYFRWKMKKMNVPYSRYHVYAPLPYREPKWSFQKGYRAVMEAYESFSPRLKKEAHRVFHEKRMDVPPKRGKVGGAFCINTIPTETSFVLLNWTNTYHDVSVLAHELGHAIHNHLSQSHSIFVHHTGLPLAETASTFGEMLLSQQLLKTNQDPDFHAHMLAQQMDDAFASIQRQAFFCQFEIDAFEKIEKGATIPEINQLYFQNLRTQFGGMHIPPHSQYEWTSISHFFHSPFYVYAYAFGQLLVLALWDMYEKEGKDFVPRYEKFLSYGGSKDPEKMLLEIGFDPNKKQSWQKGFRLLEKKFTELKKIGK